MLVKSLDCLYMDDPDTISTRAVDWWGKKTKKKKHKKTCVRLPITHDSCWLDQPFTFSSSADEDAKSGVESYT
jgi:hypothetical protein